MDQLYIEKLWDWVECDVGFCVCLVTHLGRTWKVEASNNHFYRNEHQQQLDSQRHVSFGDKNVLLSSNKALLFQNVSHAKAVPFRTPVLPNIRRASISYSILNVGGYSIIQFNISILWNNSGDRSCWETGHFLFFVFFCDVLKVVLSWFLGS